MKNAFLYKKGEEVQLPEMVALGCHLWPQAYPCHIVSRAGFYAVEDDGIYVCLEADEPSPRAVYTKRDDPVYNDSCMEFFFQAFADDERYINFEINPNGAYLCAIGQDRSDRIFLKDKSACIPSVSAQKSADGWSAVLYIPEQLVSDAYGREFSVSDAEYIRANFYKCGDAAAQPHYSSMFWVETEQPDYHRPEYFHKIFFTTKGTIDDDQ
ncbi:MAG: carbohydrate-binding family 9-like protein [Clostridia bacterium]|nr:carbohydrate-binding family 9-like protein [Clostridia bacterium]